MMQMVTPSENTLRNKANFCANSSQGLKTFGFSWHYYINSKKGRLIASLFYLPFQKTQNVI